MKINVKTLISWGAVVVAGVMAAMEKKEAQEEKKRIEEMEERIEKLEKGEEV